jgi:hypothetical protein
VAPVMGTVPLKFRLPSRWDQEKRNRVGVLRRDDIRARGESLRHRNVSGAKRGPNNKVAEIRDLLARSIAPGRPFDTA